MRGPRPRDTAPRELVGDDVIEETRPRGRPRKTPSHAMIADEIESVLLVADDLAGAARGLLPLLRRLRQTVTPVAVDDTPTRSRHGD